MTANSPLGDPAHSGAWLTTDLHRSWLRDQATRQFAFFQQSLRDGAGFYTLAHDGAPLPTDVQELHTATRLVHSYALGKKFGAAGSDAVIDQGMSFLWNHHRDTKNGGYFWAVTENGPHDDTKLAYGHVFVLLAASSAKLVGHPDADRLLDDVWTVLDSKYWEDQHGLFADEFTADWSPFSAYRGMNANMHGVEALLTAYEVTGEDAFLERAGRILDFFVGRIAPENGWRLPEHYHQDWTVDAAYDGNPTFRPRGTTPGHSFELARLQLQHWDLCGRPATDAPAQARKLFDTALADATHPELGGFVYTLRPDGTWDRQQRLWWPVTEAIGALAAFMKLDHTDQDEALYRQLWTFSNDYLIDHRNAGWMPELDDQNQMTEAQFDGKPDIYHAIQALLFPLVPQVSRIAEALDQTDRA